MKLLEQEISARAEGSFETRLQEITKLYEIEQETIKSENQQIIKEVKEISELQKMVKEGENGSSTERLKKAIEDVTKEINQFKKDIEKSTKEENRKKINIEKCETDIKKLEQIICESKQKIEKAKEILENLRNKKSEIENKINVAKKELQDRENILITADLRTKELIEIINELHRIMNIQKSEILQIEETIKNALSEQEENQKQIHVLENENPFIENEKNKFGLPDTEYDFEKINIKELSDKSINLQQEMDKLKKMININIDEIGDTIEKQYETLLQRKEIVMKDKTRLAQTITQLDTKKRDALLEVWHKVNIDFGDIFKTLLPHARARLELIDPKDITEGIEFKVSFNGIDKESLSELSGGQRTLIALSFIFALLKYKPAPLYILDEIDAALDISHTQNIGIMIKEKFPQSQFLVVSLKDGMFNNANVLFKVAFVDGGSRVTRLALRETIEEKKP